MKNKSENSLTIEKNRTYQKDKAVNALKKAKETEKTLLGSGRVWHLKDGKTWVLTNNWGYFDKNNKQHNTILSLMHQVGWVTKNKTKGEFPDTKRLSDFLKSKKSPINKPLKQMTEKELSKIIIALEGIVKHTYKS